MNRFSFRRLALLAIATAATGLSAAPPPGPWAKAFDIQAPLAAPVFALELTPEVYATLARTDLGDLAVVDARGHAVAFAMERPTARTPSPPEMHPIAPPIPIRREEAGRPADLSLHVRRATDGTVETLDLQSRSAPSGLGVEWLIDLGSHARDGIDGLRLIVDDGVADIRVRVDVRASDDLVAWRPVADGLPLLRASDGGRVIERLDLSLPRTFSRYLALTPRDDSGTLPASARLAALRQNPAPSPPVRRLVVDASTSSEGLPHYVVPGPLPVHEIDIAWDANERPGVRAFQIDQETARGWRSVAFGSVWRLAVDGELLQSPPVPTALSAEGRLRLTLSPPITAPRLVLGYRPDRLVVVASGEPPFRLLVGSATGGGSPAPIDAALAAVMASQAPGWVPPEATLGKSEEMAGPSARVAPMDQGRVALWLVLGLGALVVGGMAWRLLRSPPDTGAKHPPS